MEGPEGQERIDLILLLARSQVGNRFNWAKDALKLARDTEAKARRLETHRS
jgi:hypothetical protein